jgi:hypothetical protein
MKSLLKLTPTITTKSTRNAICNLIYRFEFQKNISESGFFMMQFLYFVILLSSFIFCFGFIFYSSQSKDAFRKSCATKAVELQKTIVLSEKRLFSLNTISTAYRLQIKTLQALLLIAPPPQKPPLIAQLEKVYSQQIQLDRAQKKLIQQSNVFVAIEYKNLISQTLNNNNEISLPWNRYLNIFSKVSPVQPPVLAIRPDSIGGSGPNYEFDEQHINSQSVVLKWQNIFTVNQMIQKIFNPMTRQNESLKIQYGLSCSVRLERTMSKWQLKINLDKY